MTTPVSKETAIGVAVVALIVLAALPLHPIAVISFEAGVLVGLLLHSSHTTSSTEREWVGTDDRNT